MAASDDRRAFRARGLDARADLSAGRPRCAGVARRQCDREGAKLLSTVRELEREWALEKRHPLLPPGIETINPGVISAGVGLGADGLPIARTSSAMLPPVSVIDFDFKTCQASRSTPSARSSRASSRPSRAPIPGSQRSLPDSSGTSRRSTSRRSTIRSCRRSSSRARASASTRLRCDTKRRTAEANARAWATLASWGHGLEAYRPSHTRTGAPSQRRHTAVAQLHVCRGFHGRSGFGRRRFLQALCKHRTARRCIRMQSRCPALMRKSPCCAVSLQEAAPRCSLGRVAMQKVVGSNPIIRFRKAPATAGFCLPARRLRRHLKRHLRHFCPFVPNQRR